jgi:hypothetical protein
MLDLSKSIVAVNDFFVNNKWTILILIFGILIAFALGKRFSSYGMTQAQEDFDADTESNADTVSNADTESNADADDESTIEEFHDVQENDDKINKALDRGEKSIKLPRRNRKIFEKPKCKKVDLKNFVHKSLVPDMDDYISKDDVDRYYMPKIMVDKKYMLKKSCSPKEVDYSKYVSRRDLKRYYIPKRSLDKNYMKKSDCECSTDSEPEVIQKVEIQKKKKIVEVPEIVYKKVPVEIKKPVLVKEKPKISPVQPKKVVATPKKVEATPKKVVAPPKKVEATPKKVEEKKPTNVNTQPKCNTPELLKQAKILEKNTLEMSDNYAKIDDSYTYCNAKSCSANGFPGGLMTLNTK